MNISLRSTGFYSRFAQFALATRFSTVLLAALVSPTVLQAQSFYATPYTFTTFAGSISRGSSDGVFNLARFNNPRGIVVDRAGYVYVADDLNSTIRRITPTGVVETLVGSAGSIGSSDGTGSAARFYNPEGVTVDGAGNLYVADTKNNAIRKITTAGVVSTLAGSAGNFGSADGTGSAARFDTPESVAVDSAGNLYVADSGNHTIRKITATGIVSTFAGTAGSSGSNDGTGGAARFSFPVGIAVDGADNLYVADYLNSSIRKITPTGVVTTLAGSPGNFGSADGTAGSARFYYPSGVAVDSMGNIFATDFENDTIRKISPAGVVTTLAGVTWSIGSADGISSAARFNSPFGITVDSTNNIYVADSANNTIRKITLIGEVTTYAGSAPGSADGIGSAARFNWPAGVAVDGAGAVYVTDISNGTIRKITPVGEVTTFAGSADHSGSADGLGSNAQFHFPYGLATDSAGNVFVADRYNCTIRKITPAGMVTTLAGIAGSTGSVDGTGSAARFNTPMGITVDAANNIYVTEYVTHAIRKITSAGVVTTFAGSAGNFGSTDGTGTSARFNYPEGIAADGAGNVYVADSGNITIRKITPDGVVTTLAGSAGNFGSIDGTGSAARFYSPSGVAVDRAGNVYVTDMVGNTIRKITSTGVVTTLGGNDNSGSADGTGSNARFNVPTSLAVDGNGILYVADSNNYTIRKGVLAVGVPAFTTQPTNQTDPTGDSAVFTAAASGIPAPTFQWQRLPAGSGTWADLSDGGSYSGSTTGTLTVISITTGMSGDQFRCVATNSAGSVSSNAVLLTVMIPPSNAIITITVQ